MSGCSVCGSTQNQATPKLCQPCVDRMRNLLPTRAPARLFKKGDRVYHRRRKESGTVVKDQVTPASNIRVQVGTKARTSFWMPSRCALLGCGEPVMAAKSAAYAPELAKVKEYPHTCPKCGAPSFNGAVGVDCSKKCGVRGMMTTT